MLETISEHFNVETVPNLCKWKIVVFDGISYEDVSETIQSYFTNRSENWTEISGEHCSWFGLSSRPPHDLNLLPRYQIACISCSMGCGIVMYKHTISLESFPSPGKEILPQDANVALLATHHHHPWFAWCMESSQYHEEGADISICFLSATVH